jgi:hypothetical protein
MTSTYLLLFLNTLFLYALNLSPSVNVRGHILQIQETTAKITILCILILAFLDSTEEGRFWTEC